MQRKNIALWVLYDFANSVTEVTFYLYFSQWLVIDRGVADLWFNMLFVVSTVLLFVSAPATALLSDRMGVRMPFLRVATVGMFLCFAGAGYVAAVTPTHTLAAGLLFLGANYCYQFSFVFYNPILEEIASAKHRGMISGIGQSANWLGQMVGILIVLPLASGTVTLLGHPGRAQTLLPATIIGALLALPMLLFFTEQPRKKEAIVPTIGEAWRGGWKELLPLFRLPGIAAFLGGYFLFNDAILTATDNFPIFLEQVWRVTDTTKSILLMAILLTSAVGALVAGWIADRVGVRRCLIWLIGLWAVCLPIVGLVGPFPLFVLSTVVMGLLFGAVWTVTRTMMIALLPSGQLNYGMSFYMLAERFSTLIGPLAWGSRSPDFRTLVPFATASRCA